MDTIRMAIFGCGGMANGHAARYKQEQDVQVVACCDILPASAKAFAERHGIPKWYTDPMELLAQEQLDACSVVTTDTAHCPLSLAAFKKGLHVLCEKPLAISVDESRKMLRAARASGKMHMVNFSHRTYPAFERARELIAEGQLGRVMHVEASYLQSWLGNTGWGDWRERPAFLWRMSKKHHGGTLVDIGCHILICTSFVVGDVAKIGSQMKSFDKGAPRNRCKGYTLDADDSFVMTTEFASGALGVIHSTRWAQGHPNTLRLAVYGDKGGLEIDSTESKEKLRVCTGDFHCKHGLWVTLDAHRAETSIYTRFIRSIRTGKPETPTFEDGHKIQCCLDACRQSAETGRTVAVKA